MQRACSSPQTWGQVSASRASHRAGVLWEQHQPQQSGDKVSEIADTAPLLEKAPRWPKKIKPTPQPISFLIASSYAPLSCLGKNSGLSPARNSRKEDKLLYLWQKWSRPSVISPKLLRGEDFLACIQAIISHWTGSRTISVSHLSLLQGPLLQMPRACCPGTGLRAACSPASPRSHLAHQFIQRQWDSQQRLPPQGGNLISQLHSASVWTPWYCWQSGTALGTMDDTFINWGTTEFQFGRVTICFPISLLIFTGIRFSDLLEHTHSEYCFLQLLLLWRMDPSRTSEK